MINFGKAGLPLLHAKINGLQRKGGGILDAIKSLFLRRRHHHPVLDQTGRGIMIVGGYSQNINNSPVLFTAKHRRK